MQKSFTWPLPATRIASHLAAGCLLTLLACASAASQTLPPIARTADLSGPRFGLRC